MKRIFLIAALFALPSTAALALIDTDGLVAGYQADGYTAIEVTRGLTQTKIEAIRGTEKIEVIYDNETGATLSSMLGTPAADDDLLPGVTVRDLSGNFLGNDDGVFGEDHVDDSVSDDGGNDDGIGHDSGDDNGNDGSDHDGGDDHDSGSDHDGGDDHDSGSDD
jgi:hypothetical protein